MSDSRNKIRERLGNKTQVLHQLYRKFSEENLNWTLTGSTSFALRGLNFDPDDIDIQVDEDSMYRIDEILEGYAETPLEFKETGDIKSYLRQYEIDDVQVEVIGGLQKKVDGKWEEPVELGEHRECVEFDGMALPVLSLEYEADAYRKMGRNNTADKLEEHT